MIKTQDLSIGYNDVPILKKINLEFLPASLHALLGRNGSGKSTLLRALVGLGDALQGQILVEGKSLSQLQPEERAKIISFVSTSKVRVPHLKCKDIVALGRYPHTGVRGRLSAEDRRIVLNALEIVGMGSYSDRSMDTMSDGECQRIMIARALAQDTPIILLDEPTSFLDLPNRYDLGLLLQSLAVEQKKCVLFSTHELDIALSLCHTIALIDPPSIHHLNTVEMVKSGHIERLFSNEAISFDAKTGLVRLRHQSSS